MRYVSWAAVCILFLSAGPSYAGENEGAVISFDLEWDDQAEKGNQKHVHLKGPGESVVLSVYADGISNLVAYALLVRFDTTRMFFAEEAGYTNRDPLEFDVFFEAGLTGLGVPPIADPADTSIITLGLVVPPPRAGEVFSDKDKAPDGDGKLLGWMKFTTLDPFEGEARFSLVSARLKGVDGNWDEVSLEGEEPFIAVELCSWGQIKAMMDRRLK